MTKKPPIREDLIAKAREPLQARRRLKANTIIDGERNVRMTFFIPLPTYRQLQDIRVQRGTSMQQLVAEAVDKWLLDQGASFPFKPEKD